MRRKHVEHTVGLFLQPAAPFTTLCVFTKNNRNETSGSHETDVMNIKQSSIEAMTPWMTLCQTLQCHTSLGTLSLATVFLKQQTLNPSKIALLSFKTEVRAEFTRNNRTLKTKHKNKQP